MTTLLCLCRPGFESGCAQELAAFGAVRGVHGYANTRKGAAYVLYVDDSDTSAVPRAAELIFSRTAQIVLAEFTDLDVADRLSPMLERLLQSDKLCIDVEAEAPDSAEAGVLKPLARGFGNVLRAALKKHGRISAHAGTRLHVTFLSTSSAILSESSADDGAWREGIPRLRFPPDAPSRSTLKLEEALLVLLDGGERERWLKPEMSCVDLGASPGGWTYQFVKRSIRVFAVDNGPIDERLLASGLVTHLREDGFRYRPKKPVDWLVCDMVEQPARVASLMASWLRDRHCRFALFNLKLPMKKRFAEVQRCLHVLHEESGLSLDVRAKQLYHDREEITVFARVR